MSMLEDVVGAVEESIEGINRKFPGVVTGKVTSLQDPLSLGRVQVQLPFIDASDTAPWARVATPFAGMLYGHYFLPAVDSEVLVAFEHGDVRVPYIIGGLWTAMAPPPLSSSQPVIHGLDGIPDLVVRGHSMDLAEIFWGDANPVSNYMQGAIKTQGRADDVMRLDAMAMFIFLGQ